MSIAEEIEWDGNWWILLPNMHHARSLPGVSEMSKIIFVIVGQSSTSIEYYNIATNTFNVENEPEIPAPTFLAVAANGSIYILSKDKVITSIKTLRYKRALI